MLARDDYTQEERDWEIEILTRGEQARSVSLKAFARFDVTVRHGIPDHYEAGGEVRYYRDGRIEANFQNSVEPAVYVHELGHVVDTILANRTTPDALYFSEYHLPEDPRYKAIQQECTRLARQEYIESAMMTSVLKRRAKSWGLSGWIAAYKLRKLESFLEDYAGSVEEGFANAFSLMMLSPDEAAETAPTMVAIITERMNQYPDLKRLLEDFQALQQPMKKS